MKRRKGLSVTPGEVNNLPLRIMPRHSIEANRWDDCVSKSKNESPLACCKILDILTPGWYGVIIGDYIGVMPLPVVKQFGFLSVQMPQEVISLGIFSSDSRIVDLFPVIFDHPAFSGFKFINYNGSPTRSEISLIQGCRIKQTFELYLNNDYEKIYRNYSRTHRRNIKAFHNSGLSIDSTPFAGVFTSLIAEIGKNRSELYMPPQYRKRFENMTKYALENDMGETCSVRKNNQLIGGAFFLKGKKRVIPYHLATPEGRRFKTSFAIIDHFIKEHSGQDMVIDFAGSVLPNVATFNRRFGARPVPYCTVTINRLPQPLRMAKNKNLLFKLRYLFRT
ncbi:MAG: hypothetical protein PWQ17_78 [Anaerophaga sp.]|nr:hypothetical protein [Anaerophaga sp.]